MDHQLVLPEEASAKISILSEFIALIHERSVERWLSRWHIAEYSYSEIGELVEVSKSFISR
jgi:predicted DNA-binding protein YlxM (UPF0122 family)